MKNSFIQIVLLFAVGAVSVPALAVNFEINHGVFQYDTTTVKNKAGNVSTEVKTTTMATFPNDLELVVGFSQYSFHVFPTQPGVAIEAGMALQRNMEVGLILGINSREVDAPKYEESSKRYGVYGDYVMGFGKPSFEFGGRLILGSTSTISKDAAGTITAETDISTMILSLAADLVYPLGRGFHYVAGLGYSSDSSEEKKTDADIDRSELLVKLAAFRYQF